MGNLTDNFDREEFACKCGCGYSDIDLYLVEKLQMIRHAIKESITIVSGCRCEEYNKKVGGVTSSAHVKGKAADIYVSNSKFRYKFLKQAFKLFFRIEVPNGSWVHVDTDESLPQEVCFTKS